MAFPVMVGCAGGDDDIQTWCCDLLKDWRPTEQEVYAPKMLNHFITTCKHSMQSMAMTQTTYGTVTRQELRQGGMEEAP